MTDTPEVAIDLTRVQAEINEEVKRRRAAGYFPPSLERELDAMFARYAPAGTGDDFDDVMAQAETQSFVHADVPTLSNVPGLNYVKKALRRVMAWYMRFITGQITAFAGAISRAVRLLGIRVEALERLTVVTSDLSLREITALRAGPDLTAWVSLVVAELGDTKGRVLHTECGSGPLLGPLTEAGVDAYGVEPVEHLVVAASQSGLDVRADDALTHLRALPDGGLAGLVLSGAVDALPLGEVIELADRAGVIVSAGGVAVVISGGPPTDPVVADLSPGRPLHAETWVHLLSSRGFGSATVHPGAAGAYAVVARRDA